MISSCFANIHCDQLSLCVSALVYWRCTNMPLLPRESESHDTSTVMQKGKSSHWPGISFTVVLPGNNVLEQLATSDSGNESKHSETKSRNKLISLHLQGECVAFQRCGSSTRTAYWSHLDWYVEVTAGYRNVSSLKWLQLHVCSVSHVRAETPSAGNTRPPKSQENPDSSRCSQAPILLFQLEGKFLPAENISMTQVQIDFPSNTDQIKWR